MYRYWRAWGTCRLNHQWYSKLSSRCVGQTGSVLFLYLHLACQQKNGISPQVCCQVCELEASIRCLCPKDQKIYLGNAWIYVSCELVFILLNILIRFCNSSICLYWLADLSIPGYCAWVANFLWSMSMKGSHLEVYFLWCPC